MGILHKLQRAKDELVDLTVSSEATIGERDRLVREVTTLNKERDEARVAVMESKTDQECKEKYINNLVFLLEPHLGLLPTNVVDDIKRIPEEIGADITPTDCRAPKHANPKGCQVTLSTTDP